MRIAVKVVPKSSRDRVAGWTGGVLRICVAAPPERGRANAAAVRVLSGALGVPESSVSLVAGAGSPRKLFEVDGLDEAELRRRLP